MICNQSNNKSVAIENFSIEKNQTVKRILVFIKNNLTDFELKIKDYQDAIILEDDISKELFRFFNDRARSENLLFQFNEKKGVDFTVFVQPSCIGASPVFMIEAKRLSRIHYEYVYGDRGGIERIKREQELFGANLNCGAMLGYIQDNNSNYWLDRINTWIANKIEEETDIIWNEMDKLVTSDLADYTSKHDRISKDPIELYHFWIDLN